MRPGAAFVSLFTVLSGLLLAACTSTVEPTATVPSGPTKAATASASDTTPSATAFYGQASTLEEFDKRFPFPPPASKVPTRYGGTLVWAVSPWTNLDPRIGSAALHYQVYESLFEGRLGWEWPDLQYHMETQPVLAESWENPDPLTYIFKIRQGVKWQNLPPVNGREFTAEDVKYAFESHQKGGVQFNKVADIDKMEVMDKYTLKATLKQPYGGFVVDKLGAPIVPYIFSKEADQAEGGLKDQKNVVGTGAYQVKEIRSGESFTLEKNPNYWEKDYHPSKEGNKLPYLDAVKGLVFKDAPAQIAAFRVGQVDALILADWETVRDIIKTNPDTFAYRVPSATWGNLTMFFKLDKKPYDDIRVRRALSLAIDRQHMRETLYGGKDEGDIYPPIPWVWTWPQMPRDYSQLGPWYEYNPKKAKELLAEAGYPNGFKAKVQYTYAATSSAKYEDAILLVKEYWRAIGVELDLLQVEPASLNSLINEGKWEDMLWNTISVGGPGYDDMVYWTYDSKAPAPRSQDHLNDPVLDKMLDDQRKLVVGSPEHTKAAQEIFKYLADKMYRIPTVVNTHYEVQQPWVQGAASAPYNWWIGYALYYHKYVWFSDKAPKR